MNWAIDRVKKTKKILKEMNLIEVVQKKKYYYVHLFFIYTEKKIGEILGNATSHKTTKSEDKSPKKEERKTTLKPSVPNEPNLLEKWLIYCDKNAIKYSKNNLKYWEQKLEKRVTLDQQEAIYKAINNGWKDFYVVDIKKSK